MDEFIKEMMERGAEYDRACSEIERTKIIEEAEKLYKEHFKQLNKEKDEQSR